MPQQISLPLQSVLLNRLLDLHACHVLTVRAEGGVLLEDLT